MHCLVHGSVHFLTAGEMVCQLIARTLCDLLEVFHWLLGAMPVMKNRVRVFAQNVVRGVF